MDQLKIEKLLSICYAVCAVLGGSVSITTGVAWGHWRLTLDQCVGRNCSCILFGEHTPTIFLGGDNGHCIWITFGPLLYVFFCLCMVCFHGYRVLFTTHYPRNRTTRTVLAKLDSGEPVQVHAVSEEDASPLPRFYWIIVATFTSFFTVYSFIHFIMFITGFKRTCNEYRKTLEGLLKIHGSALPLIHNRLSCLAIFDSMDYLQPISEHAYRNGFINTSLDLYIGLLAAFFCWISFGYAAILNITMAKRQTSH